MEIYLDAKSQAAGTPTAATPELGSFGLLPVEMILAILRKLSPPDLCKIPRLNRTFKKLIADNDIQLWKPLLLSRFSCPEIQDGSNAKNEFFRLRKEWQNRRPPKIW